jgi:hypothetical protein
MRRALSAAFSATLWSGAALAQGADARQPVLYAVVEVEGPTAEAVIDGGFGLDFDVPRSMTSAVDADLQLDEILGRRVWQFAGPFETAGQADAALPWDDWLATSAAQGSYDALARWMRLSTIKERFTAVLAVANGGPDPARPANEQALLLLWRVKLAREDEERAHELLARRLVPAMAAVHREVVLLRARDAEWDALLLAGPFATGDEADAYRSGRLEGALLDPITEQRERGELASLITDVDRRVVYRWIAGEPLAESVPPAEPR